jgi:Putative prokaryotic signal transducing protein
MKNLLQTHSISWAQSVKLTLESEGIEAVILDENAPGYMGFAGRIRVAVINDVDLTRAQTVLSQLTPPIGAPPPSWRLQKRGLQLLALGLVLIFVTASVRNRFEPGALVYASVAVTALAFIAGFVLIALGWRADKGPL